MRKVIADLRGCKDKEALHEALAEAFAFPDYYGKNLDALYDLLTEISEDTCAAVLLPEVAGDDAADDESPLDGENARAFAVYVGKVRETLEDAEFENTRLCVLVI